MKEIECVTRKWGSSVGIVIPKEIVEKEHIKPNEKVRVTVSKITFARDLWGIAPRRKSRSAQEIKDWLRKGW